MMTNSDHASDNGRKIENRDPYGRDPRVGIGYTETSKRTEKQKKQGTKKPACRPDYAAFQKGREKTALGFFCCMLCAMLHAKVPSFLI